MADHTPTKRKYKKECTVEVNVGNRRLINASMLIKAISDYVTDIYACVPKGSECFDITLPSVDEAKILADEEVFIDGQKLSFRLMFEDTVVVSFMHLPSYIEDYEIENYLISKGAVLKSEIKHRLIKGTSISDGTRYVRVEFSDTIKSLPYSVGFNTLDGFKYFRVLHNNQVKVCFKCNSPDHELRSCPETKCFRCHSHGHIAKFCEISVCDICGLVETICDCHEDDFTITPRNKDEYDTDFPPVRGARDCAESPAEEISDARPTTELDSDEIVTDDNTTEVTNDMKNKPKGRKTSDEWQISMSKRARRTKLSFKVSDHVIKDNDIKNKMRENRKYELEKRKEIQAYEKREISKGDKKNELSLSE